jgi:hypothetical protein
MHQDEFRMLLCKLGQIGMKGGSIQDKYVSGMGPEQGSYLAKTDLPGTDDQT